MSEVQIKIKKDYFIISLILILLIIFASVYFFYYKPKQEHEQSLVAYKKGIYDSVLCQYSCPLVEQEFQKTNQSLPSSECVQECTNTLKALNISGTQFSDAELLKDSLFADLDLAIRNCQENNKEIVENITIVNNSGFFECVKPEISSLKENYEYLK